MAATFTPRLDVLPVAQRRLWPRLSEVPGGFVLYGGTAIALHLGHRQSVDFDFFGGADFDPDQLYAAIPFLSGSRVVQKSASTLTCIVAADAPVQLSFFGTPALGRVEPPLRAPDINLAVAGLLDLAGTKAAVVQKRAEAKDYIDIDALVGAGGVSLGLALAAGRRLYGSAFNPEITLKALSYFADGNLASLPAAIRDRLAAAVRDVELDCLPDLPGPPHG